MTDRLRVLLLIAECNPEWASLPRFAYLLFEALNRRADVTLVTHWRNREALSRVADIQRMVFIRQNPAVIAYHKLVWQVTMRRRANWFLLHALSYPVYAEYDARVYETVHAAVRRGEYDVVHAYTPINPRYPYSIVNACDATPFVLGPVNGGLPYPPGFQKVRRSEYGYLQRLGAAAHLLPGYKRTYLRAAKILAGSGYTYGLMQRDWHPGEGRLELLCDTGVDASFFLPRGLHPEKRIRLLFVGRLVPLKGVDMLLDALKRLEARSPAQFDLTIVGDGEERTALEQQAGRLGISDRVRFAGWVSGHNLLSYYQNADLFCFPSIREFGGAVVLEAMAAGLPCLVADYGGISDFVTPDTGIKVPVGSRAQLVDGLVTGIGRLASDQSLRTRMGAAAAVRAREFTWDVKAERLLEIYEDALTRKSTSHRMREL